MSKISDNIKAERIKHKMSQEELAGKLYVTRQTVSNYETGKSNPDIETLQQLADVFETDLESLIYGKKTAADRREVIKAATPVILCILLAIAGAFFVQWDMERLSKTYTSWGSIYLMTLVGYPVLAVIGGYYLVKFLEFIMKGKQIKVPGRKVVHIVIVSMLIVYFLLISTFEIPVMLQCINNRLKEWTGLKETVLDTVKTGRLGAEVYYILFHGLERFPVFQLLFGVMGMFLGVTGKKH